MYQKPGPPRARIAHRTRMPINAERLGRLRDLGLTEYQARAYLALLDLGEAPAKDVAVLGRIPKAKVYGALESLAGEGLAEARPAHPRRYAPLPVDAYVLGLAREARRRADALEHEAVTLAEDFSVRGDVDVAPRAGFSVLRGRRNVHQRVLDAIAHAESRLTVRASPGFLQRFAHAGRDALVDARRAGVHVLVLADAAATRASGDVRALAEWARVREAPGVGNGDVTILVVDRAIALLVRSVPDDTSLRAGDDVALVTRDPAFAEALEDLAIGPLGTPEQLFYRESS